MIDIKTVTIVGAGNVASWFAFILAKNGFLINQIYSRSISNANELSAKYSAEPIDDIKKLSPNSDLYLFALKDDVYLEVLDELSIPLTFAVHTSGSIPKRYYPDIVNVSALFTLVKLFLKHFHSTN